MADIKKFLDKAGTSTLWSKVATELNKKATKAEVQTVSQEAAAAQTTANEAKAAASANATAIKANTDAITILNSAAGVEGSVAYKITKMVLESDEDGAVNKIQEIAAWIADHPTDAAEYNQRISANTEAIAELTELVGSKNVATQIAEAIDAANLDQYALASDLNALATRVGTAEGDITGLKTTVQGHGQDISQLQETVSGIVSVGGEANLINSISVNGVTQTITDKNVNIEVPVVQALSSSDIDAAIAEATVQVV